MVALSEGYAKQNNCHFGTIMNDSEIGPGRAKTRII